MQQCYHNSTNFVNATIDILGNLFKRCSSSNKNLERNIKLIHCLLSFIWHHININLEVFNDKCAVNIKFMANSRSIDSKLLSEFFVSLPIYSGIINLTNEYSFESEKFIELLHEICSSVPKNLSFKSANIWNVFSNLYY